MNELKDAEAARAVAGYCVLIFIGLIVTCSALSHLAG